jgi:hypothetical protein
VLSLYYSLNSLNRFVVTRCTRSGPAESPHIVTLVVGTKQDDQAKGPFLPNPRHLGVSAGLQPRPA